MANEPRCLHDEQDAFGAAILRSHGLSNLYEVLICGQGSVT